MSKNIFNVVLPSKNVQKHIEVNYDKSSKLKHIELIWDIVSHSKDRYFDVSEEFGDQIMSELCMCHYGLEEMPKYITHFGAPSKGVVALKTTKGEVVLVNNSDYPKTKITVRKDQPRVT